MPKLKATEFENAGEAFKKVDGGFSTWCSILTTHSIQAAYALIAANWAVHGSTNNILNNSYARWSLVVVFMFIGINIFASYLIAHMYYRRLLYAEEDETRWNNEFTSSRGKRTYWPYTRSIEWSGSILRWIKTGAPIISAALLIASLFTGNAKEPDEGVFKAQLKISPQLIDRAAVP